MEIRYDKFERWRSFAESIYSKDLDPALLIGWDNLTSYVAGNLPTLSAEQKNKIQDAEEFLRASFCEKTFQAEVTREINSNLVNISSQDQITRYIQYIKNELESTIKSMKEELRYTWIRQSKINFDAFLPPVSDEDIAYEIIMEDYIPEAQSTKKPCTEEINEKRLKLYDSANKVDNPEDTVIGGYLWTCCFMIQSYEQVIEELRARDIDSIGSDNADGILDIENALTANSNRLLLLHKLGIFEDLYKNHYSRIGTNGFVKLIATIIGVPTDKKSLYGFKPSVCSLRDEMNNPNMKRVVQNEGALKKVNSYLAEIGLTDMI